MVNEFQALLQLQKETLASNGSSLPKAAIAI